MRYALLAVLVLTRAALGVITYDSPTQTLTYGAASDLSVMVDPLGEGQDLTDPAAMFGNRTKDQFNALHGLQVIGMNCGLNPSQWNLTATMNVSYDASHVLTLNHFGDPRGYNVGGGETMGRNNFSGANVYDHLGGSEGTSDGTFVWLDPAGGTPSQNWFAVSFSVDEADAGVSAFGFVADGRDWDHTQTDTSKISVILSDHTVVAFDTVRFGGSVATDPAGIGFFYTAPAGLFIHRVEATRYNKTGGSFVAIDDLGFVITRPGTVWPHDGDTNNDGACNVVDLGVLAKYYDSTGLPTSATDPFDAGSWQMADFNNDGNVNVVDLGVLAKNYDWTGTPAGTTPEPMTLSLLAVGGLALLRRRK